MMLIANQHGDEYVVSNWAVEIIRALTRNSSWARSVRDELTITIMPRVNIDGFDVNPSGSPWRVNCREKLGLDPVSTLPPQEAMPDDDEATFDGNGWVSWSTE
jgi:Zinc carboxypeptidase